MEKLIEPKHEQRTMINEIINGNQANCSTRILLQMKGQLTITVAEVSVSW